MKVTTVDDVYANPLSVLEFSSKELQEFLSLGLQKTKHFRKLVDLPPRTTLVVGDVHGDLIQIKRALWLLENHQVDQVVFNGDVIDRGSEMIECVALVVAALIKYDNKVLYLRGNHELESINSVYGFRGYSTQFFGYDGYNKFQNFFSSLPLAAKLGDFGFISHGGVPTETIYFHLMRLSLKEKEPKVGTTDWQLIWNDPDARVKNFLQSHRGQGCYKFGLEPFNEFMRFHELNLFVRAHSVYKTGYKWFFNNRLLSIFSSKAGPYKTVNPHFAIIESDESVSVIPTNTVDSN